MSDLLNFFAQNFILTAAFLGVLLAWGFYEISLLRRGFKAITPQQLVMLINRENPRLVDLATNNEYLKAHIAGAVNMPFADFALDHKAIKAEQAKQVVLYDRDGRSASSIAQKLQSAGFEKLAILEGGLDAWIQEQLPCVRGR